MLKRLILVIQIIWTIVTVGGGTLFGVAYGWETYGFGGAIGCGLLGFIIGAIIAAAPAAVIAGLLT